MALTNDQIDTISAVSIVMSVLSVIGSSFIIVSYLYYTHLRKFAFKLVFILSVNDFFNQIGDFLLPSPGNLKEQELTNKPSDLCLAQAYMESFFELSSVLWTTAIAATLYMTVFLRIKNPEAKMPIFVAVCYGVPLVMTIIPGAIGAYGPAGAWCWISRDYDYLRFVQFFIPLWIAILFNAIVYFRVIRMISNTFKATGGDDSTAQQMRQIINKLRFYPLILIIVWLFATINRTVEAVNDNKEVFWLFTVQKLFSSMQGFLNAFAYGFSGGVREALRGTFSKCFACVQADSKTVADQLIGGSSSPGGGFDVSPVHAVPPVRTRPSSGAGAADDGAGAGVEMSGSFSGNDPERGGRVQQLQARSGSVPQAYPGGGGGDSAGGQEPASSGQVLVEFKRGGGGNI